MTSWVVRFHMALDAADVDRAEEKAALLEAAANRLGFKNVMVELDEEREGAPRDPH